MKAILESRTVLQMDRTVSDDGTSEERTKEPGGGGGRGFPRQPGSKSLDKSYREITGKSSITHCIC